MTPTVRHDTFVIERRFGAKPAGIFAAWARPEAKARWFSCHDGWITSEYMLDIQP